MAVGKKPAAAPLKGKKKPATFVIDCAKPVEDKIMKIGEFEKFLVDKIKVDNKVGELPASKEQPGMSVCCDWFQYHIVLRDITYGDRACPFLTLFVIYYAHSCTALNPWTSTRCDDMDICLIWACYDGRCTRRQCGGLQGQD